MMGNGKSVPPRLTELFCETIVSDCMNGRYCKSANNPNYDTCSEEFALGIAACFDALSRGTLDFEEHPRKVVQQLWDDVNDISSQPGKITAIRPGVSYES